MMCVPVTGLCDPARDILAERLLARAKMPGKGA